MADQQVQRRLAIRYLLQDKHKRHLVSSIAFNNWRDKRGRSTSTVIKWNHSTILGVQALSQLSHLLQDVQQPGWVVEFYTSIEYNSQRHESLGSRRQRRNTLACLDENERWLQWIMHRSCETALLQDVESRNLVNSDKTYLRHQPELGLRRYRR